MKINKQIVNKILLALLLLITLSACQTANTNTVEPVSSATLKSGDVIPAPDGEVILTVSGEIGVTNRDDQLVLDLATIEKMGLVKYTVNDPWLKEEVTYTGVLMSDFLNVIGVPDSATTVRFHALDDYESEITIAEMQEWSILLVTQTNGEYMTIENSGPTRIIFPYDIYPDLAPARDMSVWNIDSMEIR